MRCLYFPLEKTAFELNFSATETACCSAMHACFTHCVVRARLGTSPKREATSHSVNLFRELFQVVDRIVTKSTRIVPEMLRLRSLTLMHALILVRRHDHVGLKHFFVDSGLW